MARTTADVLAELTAAGGPYELGTADVGGHTVPVYRAAPASLRDVLLSARRHDAAIALVEGDERWSYAEVVHACCQLATEWVDDGLRPGERVAIAAPNGIPWVLAYWATMLAGAVAVPLNSWSTPAELAGALADSGAAMVCCDGKRYDRIAPLLATLPDVRRVSVWESSGRAEPATAPVGGVRPDASARTGPPAHTDLPARTDLPAHTGPPVQTDPPARTGPPVQTDPPFRTGPSAHTNQADRLDRTGPRGAVARLWPSRAELLAGSGQPPAGFDRTDDDPAALLSTSGTSGRPKLAVTTHRAHVTQVLNTALYFEAADIAARAAGLTPGPAVALLTFPLFHVAGLINLYAATASGGTVVLLPRWNAQQAADLIARERVTVAVLVPTTLRQLVAVAAEGKADLSSLAALLSGAAPTPPELERSVRATFGQISTGTGYGLTETTGSATSISGSEFAEHPDSIGRPFPSVLVRVVDPKTGAELPDGKAGEFQLSGAMLARGYWNRPEETAETFVDGWLRTGDLGLREPGSGRLRLLDRSKDVVIRGGENIYCAEIEACLHEHPDVADVAVFGLPDDMYGEVVAAVVVPTPGVSPSGRDLRAHVGARLASFKVPAVVVLERSPLPRNAVGKVLKRELRARFASTASTPAVPPASAARAVPVIPATPIIAASPATPASPSTPPTQATQASPAS